MTLGLCFVCWCLASVLPVEPSWNASIGADEVLRLDSSKEREFEWSRYAMTSKDTVFKPNTRYEVTFRAQLFFANACDVKVYGSDYRPSKSVTPAVVYDAASCRRLDVR